MTRRHVEQRTHAKAMRSEPTGPEARLWYHLRAKRLNGVKFSRQVLIGIYTVDFAARSRKLAIELDGDSHAQQERYDAQRTAWLEEQGYRVIRFLNSDVMKNEAAVLRAIIDALDTAPLADPLPASGEREI
ncbi:MAG: endonuclease domain-containing protein [Sphingomonas sp.]